MRKTGKVRPSRLLLADRPSVNLPTIHRSYSPRNSEAHRQSPHSNPSPSKRSHSSDKASLPDIHNSKSSHKTSKPEPGRYSNRSCGVVKGFAAKSFAGRHHNEDRVSIIINLQKPENIDDKSWPRSCLFGLFDGHAGKTCAEFLKARLPELILTDQNFPFRPKNALNAGFLKADEEFLVKARENGDTSGSCGIVLLLIGDKCFVANTGDSCALLSVNRGKVVSWITSQHKPADTAEYNRVINAGGKIYNNYLLNDRGENVYVGSPLVSPGKLKITRAFGDFDAKDEEYGGNPNVVIVEPEVKSFKIKEELDFIVIGSGAVFEKLSGREVVDIVFKHVGMGHGELGEVLLGAVEEIIGEATVRKNENNLTVVIIGLKGLKLFMMEKAKEKAENNNIGGE